MKKSDVSRYWMVLSLFLLMLVDAQISNFLKQRFSDNIAINSSLLLLVLMFGTFRYSKRYMLIVATFIGLLFDSYFYGVIGIYLLCLPLSVYLVFTIFNYVKPTIASLFLSFIIMITFVQSATVFIQTVFQVVKIDTGSFITENLGPTLIFNGVVFIILIYPLKKLFLKK